MELNLNLEYPRNSKYDYEARLSRINLDKEMEHDMATGKGFFIKEPQAINKVIKDIDSICSTRFSHTLQDPKAYEEKYSCKCGFLKGRDNRYIYCEHCHTECTFVGDDFQIFGWIPLKFHAIIHPNLYKTVAAYFGDATLEEIIEPSVDLNKDGMPSNMYDKRLQKSKTKRKYSRRKRKVDPTYQGIGMIEFEKRFDEILEYFHTKNKKKKTEYYDDIVENRELIFIHNIPVYTTLLRAFKTDGKRLIFEKTNALFNMMAKLAGRLNDDSTTMAQTPKYCNSLLWDIQERYNKLYREIELILANKKGSIRLLIGGRCAFTSRLIIVPDPTLRSDQVKLSYYSLVELLQQTIIRVLSSTYNIPYADAYMQWFWSQRFVDKRVLAIIQNLIDHDGGLPMLINRNPTINYGSVLAMRCVGINVDSYTMSMPLTVLSTLAADFDGDCLNALLITNKEFEEAVFKSLCPRNCMLISNNDGRFNNDFNIFKDVLININGLINLSRDKYSTQQLNRINEIKAKYAR